MASANDLLELSKHLKQERLFVTSEREQLQLLNENVSRSSEKLFHLAWVSRQQRIVLDQLILGCRQVTPEKCFQQNNSLESVTFVDGYKHLSYHESKVGEFLKFLRENPKTVALTLLEAEKMGTEHLQKVAQTVVAGVYGNGIMPDDETNLLQVLKHLIEIQVASNDNPRRLLRRESCAFSVIFKLLNEGMFSAKLFLTAALHKPVMQLLMDVEWFYDIDPDRALTRFPHKEQLRRFGQPGSKEYIRKTRQYRDLSVTKLVTLAELFLNSIKNNMYCFPQSLAWIVSNLYQTVTKAQRVEPAEVRAICADLVLTFFICPAICDPEPFGITSDAPISYIARHNLMQIAQILQILAMDSKPEEADPKVKDLYQRFERGCMSFLLDLLLETEAQPQPPQLPVQLTSCNRSVVLITSSQLMDLVTLVKNSLNQVKDPSSETKQLEHVLEQLPPATVLQHGLTSSRSNTPTSTPQPTPPGTPSSIQKLKTGLRDKKRLFLTPEPTQPETADETDFAQLSSQPEDVLIVTMGYSGDCPGMLTEQKVMEQESKPRKFNSLIPGEDDPISESDIPLHEKRTRFSLSHDQDSIATSDNLEAISEAASSHSVGSDLDNENDNLSDMVSANVSGRGTPNISGRDTPLSMAEAQVERSEDCVAPNLPVIVQKTNREDVTDRFGKFEIKQELERDETKSTVSDTWSTDVLASDSEPPEQTQYERLSEVAEEMARQNLLGVVEVSELSETTSDAWSMDVLASDTSERQMDRLLELDQDDMCSISSRSQAQDESSEVGDIADPSGEDTPQVSEAQSLGFPEKNADLGSSGRVGSGSSLRSATQGGSPDFPPNNGQRGDRRKANSDRSSDNITDKSRMSEFSGILKNGEDVRRKHHSFNLFDNFDSGIESTRGDSKPESDSFGSRYAEGAKLNSRNGRDPQGAIPKNYSSEPCTGLSRSSEATARSTSPFSGQPTAFTSPLPASKNRQKASSCPVDNLSNELQDNLKMSEQQNIRIDASRLSAVLDIFDPLSQESNNNNPDSDNKSLLSGNEREIPREMVFNDLGARPKFSNAEFSSMPKIAFIEASLDEGQGHDRGDTGIQSSGASNTMPRPNPKFPFIEPCAEPVSTDRFAYGDARSSAVESSSVFANRNGGLPQGTGTLPQPETPKASQTEVMDPKEGDEKRQDGKKKAGLLHIFKEKWHKGGKRKINKEKEDQENAPKTQGKEDAGSRPNSEYSKSHADDPFPPPNDSSDDILDKYRWRPPSPSKAASDGQGSVFSSAAAGSSTNQSKEKGVSWDAEEEASQPVDVTLESRKAFSDAKKKLRLVLSTADFQVVPSLSGSYGNSLFCSQENKKDNDLVSFLRVQLAEAINLQDKDLVAQLHETIRCLTPFDNNEVKKLLKTMKEEYRTRSPYIAYLVRCRQGLLSALAHLDRLYNRVQRNKLVSNKYFISVLVRLFLEKQEKECNRFVNEFKHITVPDEKTDLVERFLDTLNRQIERDIMWRAANAEQVEEAQLCIEWNVMSSIYVDAMYPNADGDIYRDQIFHDNIQKLSQVITPNHKELCISRIYHYECPWPAAQAEIYMINAYKTPKDKVQCVVRCSKTIMNLLSMANEKSVPAADDFMPVLIYVLFKANPPSLLSTVQYVNGFYEKRMSGQSEYWWRQFCSAIEYIKIMITRTDEGQSTV